MKKVMMVLILACGLCAAESGDAPKEPAKFYKLDFVVKDLEGNKLVSSHTYSMTVSNQTGAQIRAGSKVQVSTAGGNGGSYMGNYDVGTNVDCNDVKELQNDLSFRVTVEVSSLLQDTGPTPIVRQNRWSSGVIIPFKKPTVVFSSDDATTKHVVQVEVTAIPR